MAITSQDFLDFAQGAVLAGCCSEFTLRNSCSRAYYAVYHAAKDRADSLQFPYVQVEHGGDHAKLFARYESRGHRAKILASQLKALKRKRELCDYKLDESIDLTYTNQVLSTASRLIDDIAHVQ